MSDRKTGVCAFAGGTRDKFALAQHFVPGRYGKPGEPGVLIQEVTFEGLVQIAAWPDTLQTVFEQVCRATGVVVHPGSTSAEAILSEQRVWQGESATLLRVEPLKWWLLGTTTIELPAEQGFVLDLSDARSCLFLSGGQADSLLNRFISLDLRSHSCSVGSVQSTSFNHVSVTLWRCENGFLLFIPRSFVLSLFELLCDSAEQFGYELLGTQD